MEFNGQYLTWEDYKDLGGTLDLTPFNLLEFESRRRIDNKTQNRLVNSQNIPNEVKLCVYQLCETVEKYQNESNRNVSSENTDGYSVTYKDIIKILEDKQNEIDDIIVNCLYGVFYNGEHLLYCGV